MEKQTTFILQQVKKNIFSLFAFNNIKNLNSCCMLLAELCVSVALLWHISEWNTVLLLCGALSGKPAFILAFKHQTINPFPFGSNRSKRVLKFTDSWTVSEIAAQSQEKEKPCREKNRIEMFHFSVNCFHCVFYTHRLEKLWAAASADSTTCLFFEKWLTYTSGWK